jgi:hypothetical protein
MATTKSPSPLDTLTPEQHKLVVEALTSNEGMSFDKHTVILKSKLGLEFTSEQLCSFYMKTLFKVIG